MDKQPQLPGGPAVSASQPGLTGWLKRLWHELTEPSPRIRDPELRRRARLLSGILVAVLPVSFLAAGLTPVLTESRVLDPLADEVTLVGLSACLLGIGVYALSRTARFEEAAFLAVLVTVYGTWGGVVAAAGTPHQGPSLYFLSLSVLLASALLPMPFTAILAALTIGALGALPFVSSAYEPIEVVNPALFLLFSSALMVAFAAVRHADLREIEAQSRILGESEAWWRSLAENTPGTVMAVDTEGSVLFTNAAGPAVDERRLIGAPAETCLPHAQRAAFRAHLDRVLATGHTESFRVSGPGGADGVRDGGEAVDGAEVHRLGPLRFGDRVVGAILYTTGASDTRDASDASDASGNGGGVTA